MGGLFSRSEKRFSLGQVIGFGLALSLLLNTTPVHAVTDNLNSALVSVLGTVATNSDSIASNSSTIATNSSTIATNSGSIATNSGTVATNSDTIATNSSTIATNSDKLKGLDNLSSLNTNLASVNANLADVVTKLDSINTKIGSSSGGGGLSIRAVHNSTYSGGNYYYVMVSSVTNPSKCVIHNYANTTGNSVQYSGYE